MQDDVGTRALELGHEARKIWRGSRIPLLHDDVHALLLALDVVRRRDAGAIRTVLVDDRDAHVLRRDVELRLRVVVHILAGGRAVLVAVHGWAKDILELLVLDDRGGDAHVQPQELFARLRLLRHRHALGARVNAGEDVDLLLVDEARHLIDRDVHLRLRVGKDGVDLVAQYATPLVYVIQRRFGADLRRLRAAAGKGTGDVVDEADLDFLLLCGRRGREGGERDGRCQSCDKHVLTPPRRAV